MVNIDKEDLEKTLRVFQKQLYELKDESEENLIYPVFNILPPKKLYPDYYEIIKTPISLNTLKKRVPHYTDPQPFLDCIVQIAWNARIYNAPDSIIYKYARILDKHIRENVVPKLVEKYPHVGYPNLGPLPEQEDNKIQDEMIKKYPLTIVKPDVPKMKIIIKSKQLDNNNNGGNNNDSNEHRRTRTRLRIISHNQQETNNTGKENKEPHVKETKPTVNSFDLIKQVLPPTKDSEPIPVQNTNNKIEPTSTPTPTPIQEQPQNLDHSYIMSQLQQSPYYPPNQSQMQQNQTSLPSTQKDDQLRSQLQIPIIKQNNQHHPPVQRGRGRPMKLQSPDNSQSPGFPYNRSGPPKAHIKRGRPPILDLPYVQRIKNIVKNLKRERDRTGKKWLTAPFERLTLDFQTPQMKSEFPNILGLGDIRKKAKSRKYKDFKSFQDEMATMIAGYRKVYSKDPTMLQTIKHFEITYTGLANIELAKPDRSFLPDGEVRVPFDEATVNGIKYKIGDWVLIKNPNDPNKPTVGQIFRFWSTPDGNKWFNACWYFRPEQTVHRVDRLFYKHEVMKTGQYRDNLINDLVGQCFVVHFTRYQRGDPDIKINGPMFICEFRYNEADKVFNKIRTWKACLPEEIRDDEEKNIAVGGRKFFKYPSPIRHLLPANATENDRIPEAVRGAENAPPAVGAVYLRPPLHRDDLGEYSTSPDAPKHIIRPGEPCGEGKIDFEMGTVTISTAAAAAAKTSYYYTQKNKLAEQAAVAAAAAAGIPLPVNNANVGMINNGIVVNPGSIPTFPSNGPESITFQRLKQRQLQKLQAQKDQQRQQLQNRSANHTLATIINNMSSGASRRVSSSVSVNAPGAFTLPLSITKGVDNIQHALINDTKKSMDKSIPQKRPRGEVVWFKGPGVRVEERFLNLANYEFSDCSINKIFPWNKKSKLDYDEVEEEVFEHTRSMRHNRRKDLFEDDTDFKFSDKVEDEPEHKNVTGTYSLGLRPSAKFIAHRIRND